jgi:hypothetical protein
MISLFYKLKNIFLSYNHHKQITDNLKFIDKYSKDKNINSSDEKIRLISKSFIQFKLQSKSRPIISLLFFEVFCFLILIPYTLYLIFKSYKNLSNLKSENIVLIKAKSEVFKIPNEFINSSVELLLKDRKIYIENLKIIKDIFVISLLNGYYFNVQFLLKSIKEISCYYPVIRNNEFNNAIVFLEFDCCISLLKYLFNKNNIELINVQHGDQLISAHYSFVEVNKFYFWNQHYYEMFKKMNVKCEPFFFKKNGGVKIMKSITSDIVTFLEPQLVHFAYDKKKYSLFVQNLIKKINEFRQKEKVMIRYHPRYSHAKTLGLFAKANIKLENSRIVGYEETIKKSRLILGTWSALLVDSSINDTETVILKCDLSEELNKYHFLFREKNVKHLEIQNLNLNEL